MNTKTAIIVIFGVMLLVMCLAAQSANAGSRFMHCVTTCDAYGRNCQTTCLEW